jgi:hypothetical protein
VADKRRLLPRDRRIAAAVGLFMRLLDVAEIQREKMPLLGEMLEVYDSAQAIAQWACDVCPHLLKNQKTGAFTPFAEVHYTLFGALLYHLRILVVLPRGFGKSTICTVIYPLYCICEKRKRYLMLGSYVAANARKFVYTVRQELEHNHQIRERYGDLRTEADKWTDEFFITADASSSRRFTTARATCAAAATSTCGPTWSCSTTWKPRTRRVIPSAWPTCWPGSTTRSPSSGSKYR